MKVWARSAKLGAAVLLSLALTSCSSAEDDTNELLDGLNPGEQASSQPSPSAPLPERPIDTLVEDRTSPEGTIRAYMAYLNLGQGANVCNLFTDEVKNLYGGGDLCAIGVADYANAALPDFQDDLDVAEATTVNITANDGTTASGGAAITVNVNEGVSYFEGFTLINNESVWTISQIESTTAVEADTGTY